MKNLSCELLVTAENPVRFARFGVAPIRFMAN